MTKPNASARWCRKRRRTPILKSFHAVRNKRQRAARWFRRKRLDTPIVKNVESVHVVLSKLQRAYSVFRPAPPTDFPPFQVIRILPDQTERSNNPRRTEVNLKKTFERLSNDRHIGNGDKNVINDFLSEFKQTDTDYQPREVPPEVQYVSEESLWHTGFDISSPAGLRTGIFASRTRTTSRQIRYQRHSSEAYTGGSGLHTLIRRHAQPIFRQILQELHGTEDFPSAPGERGLLAIVTTRIVSTIGVSRTAETRASAGASAGDDAGTFSGRGGGEVRKRIEEHYQNLYGVSGLRFIVFPIEYIEEGLWRIYGGINVGDSDVSEEDDTFTEDTRNKNGFYQAQRWVLGEAELRCASNSTTVQRSHSVQMRSMSSSAEIPNLFSGVANNEDDSDGQASLPYVDVSLTNISVPCVEVDIRPLLNEFAQTECRLASYYRKTPSGDGRKLTHAVNLLRRALRKFRFESTVRALYDISGCYLHGLGINLDFGMAKLLRYCASGLRRSYESRAVWLNHLAIELACCPPMVIERRIISLMLFSRRTLTSLTLPITCSQVSPDTDQYLLLRDHSEPQLPPQHHSQPTQLTSRPSTQPTPRHELDNSRLRGLPIFITSPRDIEEKELGTQTSRPASNEPSYDTSRTSQMLLREDNNKVRPVLEVVNDREFQDTSQPCNDSRQLLQEKSDHDRALLEFDLHSLFIAMGRPCSNCGTVNHIRRNKCSSCSAITVRAKKRRKRTTLRLSTAPQLPSTQTELENDANALTIVREFEKVGLLDIRHLPLHRNDVMRTIMDGMKGFPETLRAMTEVQCVPFPRSSHVVSYSDKGIEEEEIGLRDGKTVGVWDVSWTRADVFSRIGIWNEDDDVMDKMNVRDRKRSPILWDGRRYEVGREWDDLKMRVVLCDESVMDERHDHHVFRPSSS